jgi:hypothetical protein
MAVNRRALRLGAIGAGLAVLVALVYWLVGQQILGLVVSARTGAVSERIPVSEEASPIREGRWNGADRRHDANGMAQVLEHPEEGRVLHFPEGFEVTDGPDLYVWLTPSPHNPEEYRDLGTLKAASGAQSYRIPDDVNLDQYDTAIIWCRAIGVLFGLAQLEPFTGAE